MLSNIFFCLFYSYLLPILYQFTFFESCPRIILHLDKYWIYYNIICSPLSMHKISKIAEGLGLAFGGWLGLCFRPTFRPACGLALGLCFTAGFGASLWLCFTTCLRASLWLCFTACLRAGFGALLCRLVEAPPEFSGFTTNFDKFTGIFDVFIPGPRNLIKREFKKYFLYGDM